MREEHKHPILQKLEEYLKNTPKEQIDKDWSNILKDTDSEAYYEKKYQDALEKVKGLLKDQEMALHAREKLANVFSELKESEDDKIRKAIHIYLDWLDGRKGYQPKGVYTIRDMIDWVIKQDKKISVDNVIEWLECKAFQGWAEEVINIKQIVNKFKEDFKL